MDDHDHDHDDNSDFNGDIVGGSSSNSEDKGYSLNLTAANIKTKIAYSLKQALCFG